MGRQSPRFPNKYVVLGVLAVIAGLLLLMVTTETVRRPVNLWPLLLVVAGLVILYFRVFRQGPDSYLFLGTTLLLLGLLLVVTRVLVPLDLNTIWPFFMTICGLSLFLYGLRKTGYTRVSLVIPGVAAILLSFIFAPFSLGIVTRPFAEVVAGWWPVVFVALGIGLLVAHLARDRVERNQK